MRHGVVQLFHPLKAQEKPSDHQQRDNGPGSESPDQQSQRDEDQFIEERSFGDRPNYRQFTRRHHPAHLLRIQSQIISQHPGRLRRRLLGKDGNIVENRRDIVEQSEQTTGSHGS